MASSVANSLLFILLIGQLMALFMIGKYHLKAHWVINVASFLLPLFAPAYTCLIISILELCERRGGFFMRYSLASYESTASLFAIITIFWLAAGGISLLYFHESFWRFGFPLFTCSAATLAIPCALTGQANEYEHQMTVIAQENLEAGQNLTPEQVHTIYKLNVYHDQAENQIIQRDRYGFEKDNGRAQAMRAENYFNLQKYMHGMKQAAHDGTNCEQIREIYNQMAQQCRDIDLSPTEREQIRQIAHMDGIVCVASTSRASTPSVNACGQSDSRRGSFRRNEHDNFQRDERGRWRWDENRRTWRMEERPGTQRRNASGNWRWEEQGGQYVLTGTPRWDQLGSQTRDQCRGNWQRHQRRGSYHGAEQLALRGQDGRSGSWRQHERTGSLERNEQSTSQQREEPRRSNSYLDLRQIEDAPPSYRASHSYVDLRREWDAPPTYRASQLLYYGDCSRESNV